MNVMEWAERKRGKGKTEFTGMGGGEERFVVRLLISSCVLQ